MSRRHPDRFHPKPLDASISLSDPANLTPEAKACVFRQFRSLVAQGVVAPDPRHMAVDVSHEAAGAGAGVKLAEIRIEAIAHRSQPAAAPPTPPTNESDLR